MTRRPALSATPWLWWPVVVAGWSLAAAVMGAEMAIAAPWGTRGAPRKTEKVDRR